MDIINILVNLNNHSKEINTKENMVNIFQLRFLKTQIFQSLSQKILLMDFCAYQKYVLYIINVLVTEIKKVNLL